MLPIKLEGMEQRAPRKLSGARSKTFFSERSNVAHFFLKGVMLHIKLKGMEDRAPCKHIFCPYKYPQPLGVKTFVF